MQNEITKGPDELLARAFSYPYRQINGDAVFDPHTGMERTIAFEGIEGDGEAALPDIKRRFPAVRVHAKDGVYQKRFIVLAAGSNASPEQLARKFSAVDSHDQIPMIKLEAPDMIAVHSAHIAAYGSVPATLAAQRGVVSILTALAVTLDQLARINATESLGMNYRLSALPSGAVRFGGRDLDFPVLLYQSRRGVLAKDDQMMWLSAFSIQGSQQGAVGQMEAIAHVHGISKSDLTLLDFVARLVKDAPFRQATVTQMQAHRLDDGLEDIEVLAGA